MNLQAARPAARTQHTTPATCRPLILTPAVFAAVRPAPAAHAAARATHVACGSSATIGPVPPSCCLLCPKGRSMNLAIFDIDGTLTESVAVDELCFVQAFRDVLDIGSINTNWLDYHFQTDSGLTLEICRSIWAVIRALPRSDACRPALVTCCALGSKRRGSPSGKSLVQRRSCIGLGRRAGGVSPSPPAAGAFRPASNSPRRALW